MGDQLNSVIEIFLTETQRGVLGGAKVDVQIDSLDKFRNPEFVTVKVYRKVR